MMIKFIRLIFIVIFSVISIEYSYSQGADCEAIKQNIAYLASDQMAGRKPGTPGCDSAAAYILSEFSQFNLIPVYDNGYQTFDFVTDVQAGEGNVLSVNGKKYEMGSDYMPFSFSASATLAADIVFVGYGFDFNEDSVLWNDYSGLDVTGKWVMIFRGNPEPEHENTVFQKYSKDRFKVLTAKDHGAAGVLFITGNSWDKNDELVSLNYDKSKSGSSIPVINIKRYIADKILEELNVKVEDIELQINNESKPKSFSIPAKLEATVNLNYKTVTTSNVVALLEGNQTSDSEKYIIIGAHYDHLGLGGYGSGSRKPDTIVVHNGADDNASGVAALLALAEILSENKEKLNCNILFIAFSAEESGLIGSAEFISDPFVDLSKIKIMLNFDMIGRMDTATLAFNIGGTGTFQDALPFLKEHLKDRKIHASFSSDGYGPSDHAVFYSENIPVLYFNTGAHEDYHCPEDDTEKINFTGVKNIIDLAADMVFSLASDDFQIQYTESGSKEKSNPMRGMKVRLGIMPDFTKTEVKGVAVGAVSQNGPAEMGGILKGDIITAFDGKKIDNIYEYMDRLKMYFPGQTVTVDVLRDNQMKVILIQL